MISMLQSSLVTVSVIERIERIKDYRENKISQPQISCFTYEETQHLIKQSIMDAATGELCNIEIIVLIVYYPLPL